MGKREMYARFSVTSAGTRRAQAFTAESMRQIQQGTIRALLRNYGYTDRRITLRDVRSVRAITDESQKIAGSIERGFNATLQRSLAALPDTATDDELLRLLAPYFRSIRDYNDRVLIPWATKWARQQAALDFYRNNGIESEWQVQPVYTAGLNDDCDEAIAAGTVPLDQVVIDMPNHRRCPHGWVPVRVNRSTLPPADALWDGS